MAEIELKLKWPITALNGGLFISRGVGSHPVRVIDSYELIVVRSGVLEMFEGQERFRVVPGTALLLWPGRRHGGQAPYPSDLSFYWLHFTVTGNHAVARSGLPNVRVPQVSLVPDSARLYELCSRFLDEQVTRGRGPENAVLTLWLLMILAELGQGRGGRRVREPHPLAARVRERIQIEAFSPQCTTHRLAATLQCNPDYLGRIFKASYGRSITAQIQSLRMQRARRLLVETRMGVKEIAQDCGMNDMAFFRSVFKHHMGTTPAAFRRLHGHIHLNTE